MTKSVDMPRLMAGGGGRKALPLDEDLQAISGY